MIEIFRHSELAPNIKAQLDQCIELEFGHIPIVKEIEWATPDWSIIYFENNEIVTFYNIVEREITIDNQSFKIAGINNVITPKEYRGMGYSTKTLRETEKIIFDDLNCKLGVLLCADDLIPYYSRLQWYKVDCPVDYEQSTGKKLWSANTMLLSKNEKLNPGNIDLNGLPW